MINTNITKLEQDLIKVINESRVPVSATCLILEKINREARLALNEVLEEEHRASLEQEHNENPQI